MLQAQPTPARYHSVLTYIPPLQATCLNYRLCTYTVQNVALKMMLDLSYVVSYFFIPLFQITISTQSFSYSCLSPSHHVSSQFTLNMVSWHKNSRKGCIIYRNLVWLQDPRYDIFFFSAGGHIGFKHTGYQGATQSCMQWFLKTYCPYL